MPGILFICVFIRSYSDYILESTVSEQKNILHEINKNISQYLLRYESTSMNIYYNSSVRSFLETDRIKDGEEYVHDFLTGIVNSEQYIAAARLELEGNIYQAGYHYLNLDGWYQEWLPRVLKKKGRVLWIPTERFLCDYGKKPYQFVMARAVNSMEKTVGVLLFFVSEDLFKNCFDNAVFADKNTDFYILTDEGRVVTGSRKDSTATVPDDPLLQYILNQQGGDSVYHDVDNGEDSIVVCEKSPESGWTLATVTGEREAYREVRRIAEMAGVMGLLYAAFLLLTYYLLSRNIFEPVQRLGRGMKKASAGEFSHIEIKERKGSGDEISQVISRYNEMLDKIESLLAEVREEEKAKNAERIKVLSMQLSPHFIYNTLNTIKWMAVVNRQENISRMIESLVKIMRSVTYNTNEEITLKEELVLLESYVYIQKMRFQNFEVRYEIPPELLTQKINKLVLQPFVENCIQHAFRQDSGIIEISVCKRQDALELQVRDNGVGFDTNILREGSRSREKVKENHVGIRNVSERLRLNYGEDYGVRIESVPGSGTVVYVRLPLL